MRRLPMNPVSIVDRMVTSPPMGCRNPSGATRSKSCWGAEAWGLCIWHANSQLQREVALKIPKFGSGTNEKLVARFYREARSAANLSHPNLCPVFDVGEIDGTHYIAMAYIKGRTLSSYVNPDKPPSQRGRRNHCSQSGVGDAGGSPKWHHPS